MLYEKVHECSPFAFLPICGLFYLNLCHVVALGLLFMTNLCPTPAAGEVPNFGQCLYIQLSCHLHLRVLCIKVSLHKFIPIQGSR